MGQIKIFGIREQLYPIREKVSEIIHEAIVISFQYPKEKKCHRFIYLEDESFYYFEGRTQKHTIIELSIFEGRSVEAKKQLYQLLFSNFEKQLGILPMDLEITIFETPKHNWGIRGKSADELVLNYKVEI